MKINVERAQMRQSQREANRMANDIFASMVNANLEAETVVMLAAKRYFGLGEKRMREFVKFTKEVKKEYEGYRLDDIFGIKAEEEFRSIGIDVHELVEEPETLEMAIRMYQRQIEPNIDAKEAAFMRDNLKAFRKVVG